MQGAYRNRGMRLQYHSIRPRGYWLQGVALINHVYRAGFGGLVALAALALAQPASATVYVLTVTGHLSTSLPQVDHLGAFGAVGADRAGSTFSATYTIDTSKGWSIQPPGPGSQTQVYVAGTNRYYNYGDPITASVTINNRTFRNIGQSVDGCATSGVGTEQQLAVTNGWIDGDGRLQAYDLISLNTGMSANSSGVSFQRNGFTLGNLRSNVAFGNGLAIVGNTYFPNLFTDFDASNGNGSLSLGGSRNGIAYSDYFYFRPELASFALAAVPEPASWAMLVCGFGLIGGAMRQRRKAVVRFG
jgi:hypothetical protein